MIDFRTEKKIHLFFLGLIIFVISVSLVAPPEKFPTGTIVKVAQGTSLSALAADLEDLNVIRSPLVFRLFALVLGGDRSMQAGEYYLPRRESPLTLAWRILKGKHQIEVVKVTIPEGFTVTEISNLFDERFQSFDNSMFEALAPEGYLFPDTYFVPVTATATSTIKMMRDNFITQIFPVMPEVEESGRSLEEIIIMASLLEGEVKTREEREMASDILWKRLKIGMALQVDSEMGTYESPGLPEKPINNPGLISIQAAIHPTTTPYLYFLTDKEGKAHYARNFDEHKSNIAKYLSR